MTFESTLTRLKASTDFKEYYENLCALQDSVPLPAVTSQLANLTIDINGDKLTSKDWEPLCTALALNKSLRKICIRSFFELSTKLNEVDKRDILNVAKCRAPPLHTRNITSALATALSSCLSLSSNLNQIELQNIPFRYSDLKTIAKGLQSSSSMQTLSLNFCNTVGDNGVKVLCRGVKNSASVRFLDFTSCSVTAHGTAVLARLVKHQAMKRHNDAWQGTLRYRHPDLDAMGGVRRITLNNNALIGDEGAIALAEALKDDLWVKALDLQRCGIGTDGALALLNTLTHFNTSLVVVDVRLNGLIDPAIVEKVTDQARINCPGGDPQYKWLKLATAPPAAAPSSLLPTFRRRAAAGSAQHCPGCAAGGRVSRPRTACGCMHAGVRDDVCVCVVG